MKVILSKLKSEAGWILQSMGAWCLRNMSFLFVLIVVLLLVIAVHGIIGAEEGKCADLEAAHPQFVFRVVSDCEIRIHAVWVDVDRVDFTVLEGGAE